MEGLSAHYQTGQVFHISFREQIWINAKIYQLLIRAAFIFLFGTDENDNAVVYVGQAGNRKNGQGLLYRIQEPHRSIDYWTEAVIFTTTNNTFGPTEISYLENRFCNLAIEANRYIVKNGNDPNPGNITEEKECELEEYIDYAKIVIGVLGHKLLDPVVAPETNNDNDEYVFYIKRNNTDAKGIQVSDGFVVLKGSVISSTLTNSCPERVIKDREKYKQDIDNNTTTRDILFSSPSGAASFVCGGSVSGYVEWKNGAGVTLRNCEESQNNSFF